MSLSKIAKKISIESDVTITEDDLIAVIDKVADIHKYKAFAYYTIEDIKNEAWIIALEQLEKYEPKKGLGDTTLNSVERWLNKVVRNRLANLYRDKYSSVNDKYRQARMNIINSLSFDIVDTSRESNNWGYIEDLTINLVYDEFIQFIEERLEPNYLTILYDLMAGENITPYYKTKLKTALSIVIKEWNDLNIGDVKNETP